jgi:hypothetical protein
VPFAISYTDKVYGRLLNQLDQIDRLITSKLLSRLLIALIVSARRTQDSNSWRSWMSMQTSPIERFAIDSEHEREAAIQVSLIYEAFDGRYFVSLEHDGAQVHLPISDHRSPTLNVAPFWHFFEHTTYLYSQKFIRHPTARSNLNASYLNLRHP